MEHGEGEVTGGTWGGEVIGGTWGGGGDRWNMGRGR